jgi:general secretion pathway protein B
VDVIAPERTDEPAGQPDKQLTVVRPKVAVKPHIPQRAPVAPAAPAAAGQQNSPRVVQAQVPLSGAAVEGAAELPELSELSLEFRSGFQTPRIDVHVYAEEPRRRFVLVDLQKFREGDTLQNGAVLEKISPNSIQLYYQGTRFRVDR